LNIVLSRAGIIDIFPDVMRLGSALEVLTLSQYLNRDVFVIGGAKTYEAFADVMDKWIVTDIPITVEGADTFFPNELLDGFEQTDSRDLGDGLTVRFLERKKQV
jgi:dihydrofolate reductase